MKVVILAGGLSPERDVSLSSGAKIANALMERGHEVMLVDLYLGKRNEMFPAVYRSQQPYTYTIPEHEPDLEALKKASGLGEALISQEVICLCQKADRVFLALHGSIGENGQLQALLDIYGISYTGTGYLGSLLAMDKHISKQLMTVNHIKTARWLIMDQDHHPDISFFPCVVKPCGCGSSIGVTIVDNQKQLQKALEEARVYEDRIIIEEKINGREFSVGILNHQALPVIEIIPRQGFYDYKNKYQSGMTEEICPAQLSDELTEKLQKTALKVHEVLQLGYYSRVDFILDENGDAYCLEANTLPGMTPISLLPQMALAAGISYPDLCEMIMKNQ